MPSAGRGGCAVAPGRAVQLPPHALAQEIETSEQAALAPKRRGPKPDLAKAESRRVEVLEREVTRLRQKLGRAEQIIEAQKKLCELLGLPMDEEPSR